MGRHISIVALIAVLAAVIGCKKEASETQATFGKESFIGRWIPDAEKTLENKKNSPSYEPGEDDTLSDTVKNAMAQLELEVTAAEIIYLRNGREQALSYTVVSAAPSTYSLTVTVKMDEKDVEITLRLIDGKYLNLKYAGSERSNLFVWRRASDTGETGS